MNAPRTIPELIEAFGGPTGFAKVIDKTPSAASEMKRSKAIRVSYWPAIIAAAAANVPEPIPGVTLESIAQMHVAATETPPAPVREDAA